MLERYAEDWQSMLHLYRSATSPKRQERLKQFFTIWIEATETVGFTALNTNARINWLLFRNHLQHQLRLLDFRNHQFHDMEALVPFAETITGLEERRRRMESNDPEKTAGLLNRVNHQISETQGNLEEKLKHSEQPAKKVVANRAFKTLDDLRKTLKEWFGFYNGYDPQFT